MSKRGGASDVNGFISIGPESKSAKKKDVNATSKKENEETIRKRTESNKEPTKGRTRVSKTSETKEIPSKLSSEQRGIKSKVDLDKSASSSTSKLADKRTVKPSPSRSRAPSNLSSDKLNKPNKVVEKAHLEGPPKRKEVVSSSHVSSKGMKSKTAQSTPILKKALSVTSQSKGSPYKSTVAQKTQSTTSGERLRKTSQLKEDLSKTKSSSTTASTKGTAKKIETGSVKRSRSSASASSTSKPHRDGENRYQKAIPKVTEEYDDDVKHQARPYGEIPRSNTFTKEGNELESITSDLSTDLNQTENAYSSFGNEDVDNDEYKYEEDFEDYESDFEEYMESESSSSTSEEKYGSQSISSSSSSSSDSEPFDEDKMGDGFKSGLPEVMKNTQNSSPVKSVLKKDITSTVSNSSSNQQTTNVKENLLNVEEERKLDSGSYDLASHSDLRRRKQIIDIKAAIDKENASLSAKGSRKAKAVADDEGFVETYSQETSPIFADDSYSPSERLINFESARKQQINQKAKAKVKKRGAILMEMIKLDAISFNLLDIPSVPYEVYMQCYGRSNTLQIHTQTNEDAISEEVQTEDIHTTTKWTQHPVKYSSPKSPEDVLFTFAQEKLGVGCEATHSDEDWFPKLHVNSLRLHNFINNAGEMILTLLEEEERDRKIKLSNNTKRDYGFSDNSISLNVQKVGFLHKRPVSFVCFSESNVTHILTVHKSSNEQPMTIQAESEGRCIICTWSVREPSQPRHTLVASNNVASVCYHSHLVIAGLIDGAICLWDLREQSVVHARCYLKEPEWLLRSPTYLTADLEKGKRHTNSVVSIKILPESNFDDTAVAISEKTPNQVVSLDEDGLLAVWTIVESKSIVNINSGLAPWGRLRLVQSSQLRVVKAFPKPDQGGIQCSCLAVDNLKPNNLYVGTNSGLVLHTQQTSCRAKPQFYTQSSGSNARITCIEVSRCGYPLFMVGDSTGRVRIYRTLTDRPLLDLTASEVSSGPAISALQWSPTQPGLFFVLDSNSCIHIWNLCSSDICPEMSVPFTRENITCISLSPHRGSKLLAVASDVGSVDIFNLKDEFVALPEKESSEQHSIFSRYITIL